MTQFTNKKSKGLKGIIRLVLKIILWIISIPLILLVIIFVSFEFPQVQSFAKDKATAYLSKKINTKVSLGEIGISFPKSVSLSELYVEDEKADTLFYGRLIKVDLNLWDLLSKKIVLNSIELEKITGHIYREFPDGKFNFSFIPDAFSSGDKDTSSIPIDTRASWEFSIKNILLKKIYFTYHDNSSGINADLNLGYFKTDFDKFDLNRKIIHVNKIDLDSTIALVIQENHSQTKQDPGSSEPFNFDIDLNKVEFNALNIAYKDYTTGQNMDLLLGKLLVDVDKIDLAKEKIKLDKIFLHETKISYIQARTFGQDSVQKPKQRDSKPSNWIVTLGKLDLDRNTVVYDNNNTVPIKNALDFNHLLVKNFSIQGEDLYANSKKIDFNLKDLHFTEQSGLILKKFQAKISYDTTHAELKDLDLQINNSKISHHLALSYPSFEALKDSINLIGLTAEFKNTNIALKDVLYFSPDLFNKLPLKEENKNATVNLSGKIKGKLNDLVFSNLEVKTKENTSIKLNGNLSNITDPKNLYASAAFEIVSSKKDITSLVLDSLIPKSIALPETLGIRGSYKGYMKNFNADVSVKTSFGNAAAKIEMNPKAGNKEQPYKGKIDVNAFDLGKLLKQEKDLGPVTMNASIKGSGFDTNNLNAEINVTVVKAFLKNYEYKNFNLDGTLKKRSFTGNASMKDENLVFDFKGGVDLEPAHPKYTFTLDLTGADLKALNLSGSDLRLSAVIQSDIGNETGRNATGKASIRNALIIRNNRKYPVDSIVLISKFKDGVSDLKLRSEIMTADFKGDITLKDLPSVLKQHINSYFNMQDGTTNSKLSKQQFTFEINVIDPSLITTNFVPDLEKLTPFAIKGLYDSETKQIKLNADIPQIKYSGIIVDSLKLDINSGSQKLNYDLKIAEISNPTLKFENLYLGGELKNNTLSFQFNTAKDDSAKLLAIGGLLKSMNKDFELKLDPQLILNTENWTINPSNYIRFGKEGMFANNVALSNGPQSVSLNSKEKKPASPLEINFKNFEITTISRLIENKKDLVKGKIDGNVILEKQNNASAFKSDLVIRDFIFQSVPVGTIKLKASNYEDPLKYDVDLSIEGNGNDIAMKGFYKASKTKDVNIVLDVRNLNLASIEPFTFNQVSKMSGSVQGKLNLKGPVSSPDINGALNFKEAAFKPRILDSYLTVHDSKIHFDSKKIRFDNFILHDSLEHIASLNGSIDISDFKNMDLDLRLKTTDFLALNTTREDNPLYYGKIVLDSDIRIKGTMDAPTINAKIKLNKGSSITYVKPESQISKNESKGIVDFINPTNKDISIMARQNDSIDVISKMKGIELNASVNFDKSVQLKMIVDRSTGDSLYVQGGGLLDFGLDRSGKTSLSGKYNIVDGGYFLSLENLVKRSFKIQKGSSVTWSGDMLDAYVDLTAIYTIKTSPLDLVQNELAGVTEFEKNKYRNLLTFMVYLKMTGFISAPEISFDIQLAPEDRGALNGAVNTKLAQLREDETQLNKQVFALLTLRRFVGENPLESSSDGGLSSASRSSASKVLTQQLSSLSEKYVNFVDLDLGVNSFEDYSSGQQQGRTQLQVGVSKQLFNEKVTVRVGGNVDLEGERASQNNANDVAGNISIDYKLTEDGRYKLEASRENQYENPIEGELTKTAAGVVYTRNFNTFRQLFSKPGSAKEKADMKRAKAKEKQEKGKTGKKRNAGMRFYSFILFLIVMCLLLGSCNTVKYLKPGEKLYTGAKVTVQSNDNVNKIQIRSEMEKVLRPKPNQTILGIRFKLWFYYIAGENPKKGLKKWLKNKAGEPPVLYDPANPANVSDIMVNRLNNLGYFDAGSTYKVNAGEKKVSIDYTVTVTKPYTINSAFFPEEQDLIHVKIKQTEPETFIKPGVQYNLDLLKSERSRIDYILKNEGFYYFNPDYILFKADTNLRNKTINLKVTLKNDIPEKAKVQYILNDIYINPSFKLKDSVSKARMDTVKIDGYTYLNKDSMFVPAAVTRAVFLKKGEPYSRKAYSLSVSRLMSMGVFRYVNIRFTDTIINGEGRLNVYINMTPMQRRSLQLEVQAVTKSNNYTGPALTASYKNRNLFHGAELFLFNLNTNYETQFSGTQKGLNSYEVGANTQLYLPKFVIPFFTIKKVSTLFVPRTKFDLGIRNLNRVQYFNMNAANFSYGYTWKESARKEHELNPVSINFARLMNTTKTFDDLLTANPFLRKSFEEQFTIGANYSFTYNSLLNNTKRHQYYINALLDISGNTFHFIQSLTSDRKSTPENPYTLFGYKYSQYSKLSTEGRYHFIINKNSSLTNRVLAGAGIPYGNSNSMPYIKQFFSGGSNSIRAFLPRTVGPGIYRKPDSLLSKAFLDQAGDIKIEGNIEYRFTIISVLKGAIFVDGGNVWLFRKNDQLPGGEFNFSTFYKQLAIGTGFGLRLDITYFVLRFDLGMPLRRPYLQENNGWVIRDINPGDRSWRSKNIVLNIAIGYPF